MLYVTNISTIYCFHPCCIMAYNYTLEKWPEDQNNWLRRRKDWSDEMEENSFLLLQSLTNTNFDEADTLLDDGANPNFKDGLGQNALHLAVWNNCRQDLFEKILDMIDNVNEGDMHGDTALRSAAYNNKLDFVKALMNHPEIDMNVKNKQHSTALFGALDQLGVAIMDMDMVKLLLSADYKIDCLEKNNNGETPREFCENLEEIIAMPGDQELLDLLKQKEVRQEEQKADAWKKYGGFNAPLCEALRVKDKVSSWVLFYYGEDPNKVDENGMNALHAAVQYVCNPLLFNKILSRISNLNAVTSRGDTALHMAVKKRRIRILKKLLNYDGIGYNPKDRDGKTPLQYAIQHGHGECVQVFIDQLDREEINVQDIYGNTAVHYAVEHNKPDILEQLVECTKVGINAKDNRNETPLGVATRKWRHHKTHTRCVELLKTEREKRKKMLDEKYGGDLEYGYIPIIAALNKRDEESAWMLLDLGADPNDVDSGGNNALHWAASYNCSIPLFKKILDKIKNVNAHIKIIRGQGHGQTALMYAIGNDLKSSLDKVKLLLRHPKINIYEIDDRGQNAIHKAVTYNRIDVLNEMLKYNPNLELNLTDTDGQTPLAYALRLRFRDIAEILKKEMDKQENIAGQKPEPPSMENKCTFRF